jgi:hypothetical protein
MTVESYMYICRFGVQTFDSGERNSKCKGNTMNVILLQIREAAVAKIQLQMPLSICPSTFCPELGKQQ